MKPGRIVLTVMPSAATSLASVRENPVTAARIEVDSINPSIGCFTVSDVT